MLVAFFIQVDPSIEIVNEFHPESDEMLNVQNKVLFTLLRILL